MDRRRQVAVGDRRRGGFDVNDQMGRVGVAGFGDVDFVAGPGRAALVAVAGVGIVRGVETGADGRPVGGLAPADNAILDEELMHPGLPQGLDHRQFAQPGGRRRCVNRRQQRVTIGSDWFAESGARRFAFSEAVLFDPDRVALEPLRRGDTGQPVRRHGSDAVQGRAQGLTHALEPVKGTDRG